jgi:hypothetical protein
VTGLNNFFNPRHLNSWTAHWVASKFFKSSLISNSISDSISRCSIVGWEDWARELDAWEVDGVVLGIVEFSRDFCRTGGGQPRNQLVQTNLQTIRNPCKKIETQPQKATTHLNNRVQLSKIKNWPKGSM